MQSVTAVHFQKSVDQPIAPAQQSSVSSLAQATLGQTTSTDVPNRKRNWLQIFGDSTLVIGRVAICITALIGIILGAFAALCAALI